MALTDIEPRHLTDRELAAVYNLIHRTTIIKHNILPITEWDYTMLNLISMGIFRVKIDQPGGQFFNVFSHKLTGINPWQVYLDLHHYNGIRHLRVTNAVKDNEVFIPPSDFRVIASHQGVEGYIVSPHGYLLSRPSSNLLNEQIDEYLAELDQVLYDAEAYKVKPPFFSPTRYFRVNPGHAGALVKRISFENLDPQSPTRADDDFSDGVVLKNGRLIPRIITAPLDSSRFELP